MAETASGRLILRQYFAIILYITTLALEKKGGLELNVAEEVPDMG